MLCPLSYEGKREKPPRILHGVQFSGGYALALKRCIDLTVPISTLWRNSRPQDLFDFLRKLAWIELSAIFKSQKRQSCFFEDALNLTVPFLPLGTFV